MLDWCIHIARAEHFFESSKFNIQSNWRQRLNGVLRDRPICVSFRLRLVWFWRVECRKEWMLRSFLWRIRGFSLLRLVDNFIILTKKKRKMKKKILAKSIAFHVYLSFSTDTINIPHVFTPVKGFTSQSIQRVCNVSVCFIIVIFCFVFLICVENVEYTYLRRLRSY